MSNEPIEGCEECEYFGYRCLECQEAEADAEQVAIIASLYQLVQDNDQDGIDEWQRRAKAGEVMRIC